MRVALTAALPDYDIVDDLDTIPRELRLDEYYSFDTERVRGLRAPTLLLLGGDVIRPFAWVMGFGILTGTFSSMYVAAPILIWIYRKWPKKTSVAHRSSTVTRTSRTKRSTATAAT